MGSETARRFLVGVQGPGDAPASLSSRSLSKNIEYLTEESEGMAQVVSCTGSKGFEVASVERPKAFRVERAGILIFGIGILELLGCSS